MITRFERLFTVGVTHAYYDGACRDFAFTVPPDTGRMLAGGRLLARVLTFFQAHPRFVGTEFPALDPGIEMLVPELRSLTFEQLNQLWAFIGGKQLPSAVYRVRLVALQDLEPRSIGQPLTTIQFAVAGR